MSLAMVTDPGTDSQGMPTSDGTSTNPLVSITNPDQTTQGGLLTSLEGYASSAVSAVENGAGELFTGAENVAKAGYNAGKTAVGDAVGGVEGVLSFGVTEIVLIVAALGVALYFVGKSGALKVNAVV